MEAWQKFILGAAALLIAGGVIWRQFLKPTLDFYVTAKQLVPLLKKINDVFGGDPNALHVLYEIKKQFTTDSGSSLKDQINRLELAAEKQEANAEHLKVGVASQEALARDDREQLRKLLVELGINAEAMRQLTQHVEAIRKDARNVADDLAAAHKRADNVGVQSHGAAADAAAQQTVKEKANDLDS